MLKTKTGTGGKSVGLKIAVLDDEPVEREYASSLVREWAKKRRIPSEVREYPGAKAFLFDYEEERDFDILLLDVEMPGENGIELAERVRKGNRVVQIVFITGFYEYFGAGFDVAALHYLIKPVDGEKLFPVLDRALENLRFRDRAVAVGDGDGVRKLPLADILYVEADNVRIRVVGVEGNYSVRSPLGKWQGNLDDEFLRVHRSYIVNLRHVKKVDRRELLMDNGDRVPISRGSYDEVYRALIRTL